MAPVMTALAGCSGRCPRLRLPRGRRHHQRVTAAPVDEVQGNGYDDEAEVGGEEDNGITRGAPAEWWADDGWSKR